MECDVTDEDSTDGEVERCFDGALGKGSRARM